jgi:predicted DNA-binding transcriptional regulator
LQKCENSRENQAHKKETQAHFSRLQVGKNSTKTTDSHGWDGTEAHQQKEKGEPKMRKKYKIASEVFAGGLFSQALDKYYKAEFVTHLNLRNTEYDVFRLVYFYTDQGLNDGYVTYKRTEIAAGLGVTKSCVDKAIKSLLDRGLIIREPVQRGGKICPGYRVDKQAIKDRVEEAKRRQRALFSPKRASSCTLSRSNESKDKKTNEGR